jgi:hypothetical protein
LVRLIKAGYDPDSVADLDRTSLLNQYAEFVLAGEPEKLPETDSRPSEVSSPAPVAVTNFDMQMKMFELEMLRLQAEREEREWARLRLEKEREERLRREELEREERLRREELEKQRWEADRELRLREIKLKEDELARQAAKDKLDGERKRSLANRTKFFGEAMKNVLWKFPQDPAEIPGYFEHIENLFTLYEVDDDVKSKLLQAQLTDRAKSLTVRLTLEQLNDYDELKEFLLNEFKISPIQLRERFFSLRKKPDETYTLLASKLHNALMYYVRSRNISDDFDKLVSLFCADRLKELVPKGCLDFILAQEKDGWMKHDELAHSIDTLHGLS